MRLRKQTPDLCGGEGSRLENLIFWRMIAPRRYDDLTCLASRHGQRQYHRQVRKKCADFLLREGCRNAHLAEVAVDKPDARRIIAVEVCHDVRKPGIGIGKTPLTPFSSGNI